MPRQAPAWHLQSCGSVCWRALESCRMNSCLFIEWFWWKSKSRACREASFSSDSWQTLCTLGWVWGLHGEQELLGIYGFCCCTTPCAKVKLSVLHGPVVNLPKHVSFTAAFCTGISAKSSFCLLKKQVVVTVEASRRAELSLTRQQTWYKLRLLWCRHRCRQHTCEVLGTCRRKAGWKGPQSAYRGTLFVSDVAYNRAMYS